MPFAIKRNVPGILEKVFANGTDLIPPPYIKSLAKKTASISKFSGLTGV